MYPTQAKNLPKQPPLVRTRSPTEEMMIENWETGIDAQHEFIDEA